MRENKSKGGLLKLISCSLFQALYQWERSPENAGGGKSWMSDERDPVETRPRSSPAHFSFGLSPPTESLEQGMLADENLSCDPRRVFMLRCKM